MFMDYGDDDERGGRFSFADVARQEGERLRAALVAVEDMLHAPPAPPAPPAEAIEDTDLTLGDDDGIPDFHHYRRYESMGYDAHTDCVDTAEVKGWQNAFPYLRIVGQKLAPTSGSSSGSNSSSSNRGSVPSPSEDQEQYEGVEFVPFIGGGAPAPAPAPQPTCAGRELVVEGRRVTIHNATTTTVSSSTGIGDGDDDVDCSHGVIEELLAIDRGPGPGDPGGGPASAADDDDDDDDDAIPSPRSSQREEVVSLLLDAVWPEVAEAIKPLVRAVVRVCRERGITYEADEEEDEEEDAAAAGANGGGGGWVESDDDL